VALCRIKENHRFRDVVRLEQQQADGIVATEIDQPDQDRAYLLGYMDHMRAIAPHPDEGISNGTMGYDHTSNFLHAALILKDFGATAANRSHGVTEDFGATAANPSHGVTEDFETEDLDEIVLQLLNDDDPASSHLPF